MNALQKIKLSKELLATTASLKGGQLKALEKIKASKRALEIVGLLGGGSAKPDISSVPQNVKTAALMIQANMNGFGRRSVYDLSGDKKTDIRRSILELLTGESPPKSKAGVSVIAEKLKDIAGGDVTGDIFGDWIDSAAKGIYLDVEAYYKQKSDKENAIESRQKEADVFGAKYPLYADNDYFPFTTKGAKNGEWRFIIGDNGKINVRYFNGDYVEHLDDFDTLESAYQALQSNEDYQNLINTKDFTSLLNSIINNNINVFDDSTKLTELVGATQELGGDDMPDENKGLFIEAIKAAGVQMLIGKGFPLAA